MPEIYREGELIKPLGGIIRGEASAGQSGILSFPVLAGFRFVAHKRLDVCLGSCCNVRVPGLGPE